jgi:hypothetical protein
MSANHDLTTPRPGLSRIENVVLFLLLVVVTFSFPVNPSPNLDDSWRMALGQFFHDNLQFGRDVVFTYGPLGFLMGNTYSGLFYWSLLAWQLFAACSFATLILYWGQRLQSGWARLAYFGFFLLYGVTYVDSIHMVVIALIGLELVRRTDRPWRWSSILMLLLLALLSAAKFTNLMLAASVVLVSAGLALWQHQRGNAFRTVAWFAGGFLVTWMLCGQNPLNLPVYLINSWQVSQGYQEVMGIPTPETPFWRALLVMAVLAAYSLLNFLTQKDRARSLARTLIVGALLYLNWKHGFVRADGHMIGFFYSALLPIVAFPALLDDALPFRRLKRWSLSAAGVLCLLGVRDAIPPLVDSTLGLFQGRIWGNISALSRISTLRQDYDHALSQQLERYGLPRTMAVVGTRSLDVIGYEQGVAIINRFNYQPRPVFQSYSAYTPELARLNEEYYRSDRAPDFVLLKVGSIDDRLGAMDDSAVLCLLAQRYQYVHSERSFQLWARKAGPFTTPPRPVLARRELALEEVWTIKDYQNQPLWVTLDLRPSLLGRLRTFLYKPPILRLAVTDSSGRSSTYRMPAPIGRAGFIINPVINDLMGFTHLAADLPERLASSVMLTLAPEDRKYFAATAQVELSALPTSTAAKKYFAQLNREVFYMFKTPPSSYDLNTKPSIQRIDEQEVMVMHAPSEMIFDLPPDATVVRGKHGYVSGAYTFGGKTNGAEFVIAWSDGRNSMEIYRRFLNPLDKPEDRGLFSFQLDLTGFKGGRLYFRTLPGPFNDNGWDWTAWTDIEIK